MLVFIIFRIDCKGSLFAVFFLQFLSGFCGLMLGFVISVLCKNQVMATFCSIGSFMFLLFTSGFFWPLEGTPKFFRWFCSALPITLPSISMRAIIYKGSSIFEWQVLIGSFISLGWISVFVLVAILCLKWNTYVETKILVKKYRNNFA